MEKLLKQIIPSFLKRQYSNYIKSKQYKLYTGDKVRCPICNSKFKEFAPFGLGTRSNAQCQTCGP